MARHGGWREDGTLAPRQRGRSLETPRALPRQPRRADTFAAKSEPKGGRSADGAIWCRFCGVHGGFRARVTDGSVPLFAAWGLGQASE